MAKLLKPLVVIVLLLALVGLSLQAFVLFPKRTLIKERTQKLEGGVTRVVQTLRGSLSEEAQQAAQFNPRQLVVDHKDRLPQLDTELNRANVVADAVLRGWEDTKTDLENTRQDLENTRAELERTQAQLEEARSQIVQLNDIIRAKDQELQDKDRQIASLQDEKAGLEFQVSDLTDRMGDMQDQMAGLEEEKNMLELLLAKCEGERGDITMAQGTSGVVLYANPEWNFVVIDVGSTAGAQATAEMIVHRGDTMVGKIQITNVRESVSIADVLPEFQMEEIREGDHVLF